MSLNFWQTILSLLQAAVAKVEPIVQNFGREIWHIVVQVFQAEEQVIMAQLFTMLRNDAVALQNAQPGISSKDMGKILEANAQTALAQMSATLAYTAIITTVGTVMHDLSVPDNTGNAGNVTSSS